MKIVEDQDEGTAPRSALEEGGHRVEQTEPGLLRVVQHWQGLDLPETLPDLRDDLRDVRRPYADGRP